MAKFMNAHTHTHTSQNNQWDSSDYQYSTVSVSISTQKSIKKISKRSKISRKRFIKCTDRKRCQTITQSIRNTKKKKRQEIYKKKKL